VSGQDYIDAKEKSGEKKFDFFSGAAISFLWVANGWATSPLEKNHT
jgi:hypothetical protein